MSGIVWLTYAWKDNESGDIDFIAQELQSMGLTVKLDRWNIGAGRRLWEQIDSFISDSSQSDGWLLVATPASLSSDACKEEYAYALDRALRSRGDDYPLIALFPGPIEPALIPAGIRTRLHVSLTDPDWKEHVVAAVERRSARINPRQIEPFTLRVHRIPAGDRERHAIEVRPRAGTWQPFFAAVPTNEKDVVKPNILPGPRARPPQFGALMMSGNGPSDDGNWWIMFGNEATPTTSYYVFCDVLPTTLAFGVHNGEPQYLYRFDSR